MVWLPAVSVLVGHCAVPPLRLTVAHSVAAPSRKLTVPPGADAFEPIVAVKITSCPDNVGSMSAVKAVVDAALAIVTL